MLITEVRGGSRRQRRWVYSMMLLCLHYLTVVAIKHRETTFLATLQKNTSIQFQDC